MEQTLRHSRVYENEKPTAFWVTFREFLKNLKTNNPEGKYFLKIYSTVLNHLE